MLTGDLVFDVLGTALIGLLLVAVAVVLAAETKSLLLGEAATPEVQARIRAALERRRRRGAASSTCARCTWGPTICWSR